MKQKNFIEVRQKFFNDCDEFYKKYSFRSIFRQMEEKKHEESKKSEISRQIFKLEKGRLIIFFSFSIRKKNFANFQNFTFCVCRNRRNFCDCKSRKIMFWKKLHILIRKFKVIKFFVIPLDRGA